MESRPAVSVVVPFAGGEDEAVRLRESLAALRLGGKDDVVVADNTPGQILGGRDFARIVPATGERSSYHARNTGARATANEWVLFMDADCTPAPDLLDRYFATIPADRCGAVAGEIVGDPDQRSFAARYARDRRVLSQTDGLYGRGRTVAATGNLMVRRRAFDDLRGFVEGIRSGGDVDFCLRLQASGWSLEFRPDAAVRHRHRDSVASLLATFGRYAAGSRWLSTRYPGLAGPWPLVPGLVGSARDIALNSARGRFQEAAFRATDGLGLVAHSIGYRTSNVAPRS